MYKLGNKRFSYKLVLFAVDVLSSVKAVFIFLIMAVLLCNLESLCMGGSRLSPTEQDADHVTPWSRHPWGLLFLSFLDCAVGTLDCSHGVAV